MDFYLSIYSANPFLLVETMPSQVTPPADVASVLSVFMRELAARDEKRAREQAEREDKLGESMLACRSSCAVGRGLTPSVSTFAAVGTEALETLTKLGAISVLTEPGEDASELECAPLATPADILRMCASKTESSLVDIATPLLCTARGFDAGAAPAASAAADHCAPPFVNSENHRWLDALHTSLPLA